jgi:multidrug resistance protein, MATE family
MVQVNFKNSKTTVEQYPCHRQHSSIRIGATMHVIQEAKQLINIALPTVIVQFSVYFIYPQTASMVGRQLGTEELAGFSLGSLSGNMICLAVIIGVLSAANTLMPREFGLKRYEQVGVIAIQGFLVCAMILIIPMIVLMTSMDFIFTRLGQDPIALSLAVKWLRIYVLGVPFVLLLRVLQSFLACQHLVWPLAYGCAFGSLVMHPMFLRLFIPYFGFLGSGMAIVATQLFQVGSVLLFLQLRPIYRHETWSGLSLHAIAESIRPERMVQFLQLSIGGVLSMCEWWFWEVMCVIAGHMGVQELCIHTIAYNLVPISFMLPLGISIGLTVRMGHLLMDDVGKAKSLALGCMLVTIALACIVATILWHMQDTLISLFTNDNNVKEGCKGIWHYLCVYIILMYIFGINTGIMRALAMQWTLAVIITTVLFLGALPTVVHFAIIKGGGINSLWSILPLFYLAMNILLILSYTTKDWNISSSAAREKRSSQIKEMMESTLLLNEKVGIREDSHA